jgi:DNA (cytosine-5)-methyltransferase 1
MEAYRYSRQVLNLPLPEYGYHYADGGDVEQLTEGEQALRLWYLIQDAGKSTDIVGFLGGPPCSVQVASGKTI